jgi:hypothetical protein
VAEIPDKKLKRGRGKKSSPEESVADFWPKFTKTGRNGAEENRLKKFLTFP